MLLHLATNSELPDIRQEPSWILGTCRAIVLPTNSRDTKAGRVTRPRLQVAAESGRLAFGQAQEAGDSL